MYLKEWLKVFNKDQILVLRTEDYSANIKETLKTVFNFLQLGKYFHYFIKKKERKTSCNEGKYFTIPKFYFACIFVDFNVFKKYLFTMKVNIICPC